MLLRGNCSWGDGVDKVGIPMKIAAKWLINYWPRDSKGLPLPMLNHPSVFLKIMVACDEVTLIFLGNQ